MVAETMHFKITSCGLSDKGLVRLNNEDVFAERPEISLYLLADGMGGHRAGEVAAREAVEAFIRLFSFALPKEKQKNIASLVASISQIIQEVNRIVYQMSRTEEALRGMGTTLCCLCFHSDHVIYAHVGDSRIYQWRKQSMVQLTRDHSLLCELIDMGQIDASQADSFLYKNILTKAIGTEASVEPSVEQMKVQAGDVYIMCSDGLSDVVSIEEMQDLLNQSTTLASATESLVQLAKERGGPDNITIVATQVSVLQSLS